MRAQASTGHSIVLGYVVSVGMGFFIFLKKSIPQTLPWRLGMAALVGGLIAPVARGPWMGAAAMLLVFIATGPSPGKGFSRLAILCVVGIPALFIIPGGQSIINHLPFVGNVEMGSVTYRQRLLEVSIGVVMMNPVFGDHNFWYLPVMQQLKQGEGIIDLVNTFLGIALVNGLVGLFLFAGAFVAPALGILKAMKNLGDKTQEAHQLGQAMLAVLAGIMVTITTVSSITVVPVVYWSVIGVAVACIRLIEAPEKSEITVAEDRKSQRSRRHSYMAS